MRLVNIILFIVVVNVPCSTLILSDKSSFMKPPILFTDTIRILELCYADTINPIAITPNLIDTIYQNSATSITTAPIIVLNNDIMKKEVQLYYLSYPLYILSVSTTEQLESLLTKLRSLPFWNIKSTIFVIGHPENSCRDAAPILELLWQFNMLSSYVVCSKFSNQTMIYTHNPFTSRAPVPWTAVVKTNKLSARWTLYQRFFVNDGKLCDSLSWDRTKFLDGYSAKIVKNFRHRELLEKDIFPSLNLTPKIKHLQPYQAVYSIFKGKQDINANIFDIKSVPEHADPMPAISEISFVIATQKRSFSSSFREIVLQFDIGTFIAIVIILLSFITLLLLINIIFQHGLGFLDILNLLFNMEMDLPFGRLSIKILFFTVTIFMFVFGPDIQGQFLAVLSRPQSYKVENLKDLYTYRYHVYYQQYLHGYFKGQKLWKTSDDMRFLHPELDYFPSNCLKLAIKDNTVACVFQSDFTMKEALKQNLHVSQDFLFKINTVYLHRKGWVLKDRVNKRLFNYVEAGLFEKWDRDSISNPLKEMKAKDRLDQIEEYEEIDEIDLEHIFIAVAFCQILAVVVFGIENLVAWLQRRRNHQ